MLTATGVSFDFNVLDRDAIKPAAKVRCEALPEATERAADFSL